MKTLTIVGKPEPTIKGQQEGCGESVEYNNKIYCYNRAGKYIPKDKVVALKYEGFFCGRVRGEIYYILVCYNKQGELVLVDSVPVSLKESMKRFKGLSNEQAICLAEGDEQKRQSLIDYMDKCSSCGQVVIVLENEQPKDKCFTCFHDHK